MRKNLTLLVGIVVVAVLIGVVLFYFGPASLQTDFQNALIASAQDNNSVSSNSVPFNVLATGSNAISITDRTNYRITNVNDFNSLWELVYGDVDGHPLPQVDFSKYEVLAIFDGTHATGGYGVKVQSVVDKSPSRMVTILHLAPNPSCSARLPQGASSPFEIIQVPITTFPLAHTDEMGMSTCVNQ